MIVDELRPDSPEFHGHNSTAFGPEKPDSSPGRRSPRIDDAPNRVVRRMRLDEVLDRQQIPVQLVEDFPQCAQLVMRHRYPRCEPNIRGHVIIRVESPSRLIRQRIDPDMCKHFFGSRQVPKSGRCFSATGSSFSIRRVCFPRKHGVCGAPTLPPMRFVSG